MYICSVLKMQSFLHRYICSVLKMQSFLQMYICSVLKMRSFPHMYVHMYIHMWKISTYVMFKCRLDWQSRLWTRRKSWARHILLFQSGSESGLPDCLVNRTKMGGKYTKWSQNIPNDYKYTKWLLIYQMITNIPNDRKYTKWSQNVPNDHKIYQMAIKYTKSPKNNHTQHLQTFSIPNIYKLGFLVWNYAVWHPWRRLCSANNWKSNPSTRQSWHAKKEQIIFEADVFQALQEEYRSPFSDTFDSSRCGAHTSYFEQKCR
jgi:hypothetical protein